MHGSLSHEQNVRPAVCPSVKPVYCAKKKRLYAKLFMPYERIFHVVPDRNNSWWGITPSTWNFGANRSCWSENPDFQSIFCRSASAITLSEKSAINKSTTRFPMSLRWSAYVAPKPPPKGARKRKTAVFRVKFHFTWRKSATKFLCVNTVSNEVVRHTVYLLNN